MAQIFFISEQQDLWFGPAIVDCPFGFICYNGLRALSNYWGYWNNEELISFRCLEGYCCQTDKECVDIDSCGNNRSGNIYGSCMENMSKLLFSPKCVYKKECLINSFGTTFLLILVVAFGYTAILWIIQYFSFKQMKHCLINCLSNLKGKQTKSQEVISEEGPDSENSLKFLQILVYFVQDATLFHVQLSYKDPEEEGFLSKLFQFSWGFVNRESRIDHVYCFCFVCFVLAQLCQTYPWDHFSFQSKMFKTALVEATLSKVCKNDLCVWIFCDAKDFQVIVSKLAIKKFSLPMEPLFAIFSVCV